MNFTLDDINYTIGMYAHPDEAFKEYSRSELRADGISVVERDYAWQDVQEDIFPDPDDYAKASIVAFNKYLKATHPKVEGSYADKVSAFFLSVTLVENQLVY